MTKINNTEPICLGENHSGEEALLLSNQLCFPLYAAARKIVRFYTPVLAEYGLTYTQYIALLALWETDGISVKALGQRLFLDSGTLTPLLKKLESQGLLTRTRDTRDERNVEIRLTDEGRALKTKALAIPAQIASCIDVSPDEATELKRLLEKFLAEDPSAEV